MGAKRTRKGGTQDKTENAYDRIIEFIFLSKHKRGAQEVAFERNDIVKAANRLGIARPKNLGDLLYTYRYRRPLPAAVRSRAPKGTEWVIRPRGAAKYVFTALQASRVTPNAQMAETKVPDATPGVIVKYALNDEQALLARLRYNRLVDIFTGVACYPLQSHLRTQIPSLGQVETDEVYVGIDRRGVHYVFPVQAKGRRDSLGVVQIEQDVEMCAQNFPGLICRPIGAQFLDDTSIAMFELEGSGEEVRVVAERHYRLVAPEELTEKDLAAYKARIGDEH